MIYKQGKFPKQLLIAQLIFYVSGIIFVISRILTSLSHCYIQTLQPHAWTTLFITYIIHKLGFILILYFKLRLVFDETPYSLQKRTIYSLYLVYIICLILPISAMILKEQYIIKKEYITFREYLVILSIATFLVIMTIQFLAWIFVYKLYQIGRAVNDDTNLKTMRKYSILNIISIIFTSLYAICALLAGIFGKEEDQYLAGAIMAVIICFDVFIDTICMTLSLNVNERYYRYFCYFCAKNDEISAQIDTLNYSYFQLDETMVSKSTIMSSNV